jgi:hypothetical protein
MRGNAISTHRNDVDDDVIPEFDFRGAIPNPFAGLIGPNYRIRSHGNGSDGRAFTVVSAKRDGRRWLDFGDLAIPSCPASESGDEWIAREAIARFLRIDSSGFDLIIEVQDASPPASTAATG